MFELKPLSKEAIPRALEKAQRYRLLNEPVEAQSICLDVLRIDPENESALVCLLLALTDQFDEEIQDAVVQAREVLPRLRDGYSRAYYAGIICERRAKAQLKHGGPASTLARALAAEDPPPTTLPPHPISDSIEKVVERLEKERADPCRKTVAEGKPCFPVSTIIRGPETSVRESLGWGPLRIARA